MHCGTVLQNEVPPREEEITRSNSELYMSKLHTPNEAHCRGGLGASSNHQVAFHVRQGSNTREFLYLALKLKIASVNGNETSKKKKKMSYGRFVPQPLISMTSHSNPDPPKN